MNLAQFLQDHGDAWLVTGIAAVVAILAAWVAHGLLLALLRRLTRLSVLASTVLEYIARPARWVLPLFALQFVWAATPHDLPLIYGFTIATALLLIAALTWLAMRAVAGFGDAVIRLHPSNIGDNLEARRVETQTRVLSRTVMFFVLLIGAASCLMIFPSVRQIGTGLFASAGVAGLVVGIAARPVLGNLIAGLQIALAQPIRLDDVVIMEGEWGRIEEITSTYVVVKVWDERRLVVPLQWVIEHPFQNWTRKESQLLGTVFLWLDFRVPLAPLRAEVERVCAAAPEWDRRVAIVQVVETSEHAMQIRVLVSSADASKGWDLRCRVREALIDFLQREHPEALPRMRAEIEHARRPSPDTAVPPARPGRGDSTAIRHPEHPGEHAPPAVAPDSTDRTTGKGG